MEVNDVVELDLLRSQPNLLEWGKQFKKLGKDEHKTGIILHLKNGSLSSHYAIHAIQQNIAVWTGADIPKRGQMLEPCGDKRLLWTVKNKKDFHNWVAYWDRTPLTSFFTQMKNKSQEEHGCTYPYNHEAARYMIATAIATIHASTFWDDRPLYIALRAFAVVTLCKYVIAACCGELRHWNGCGPGSSMGETEEFPWDDIGEYKRNLDGRSAIYYNCFDVSLKDLEKFAPILYRDFSHEGWTIDDGGSYGGPKWANCADKAHQLIMYINKGHHYGVLHERANVLLNTVHNGGKILTKWIDDIHMDIIAEAPAMGFMNAFAGIIATEWSDQENINGQT